VPQVVKTKVPVKPRRNSAVAAAVIQHPTLTDACDLIGVMLEYETAARSKGVDLSMGRFAMLTASERQLLRAELVADYIHLSAGNTGKTANSFDAALEAFSSKICDMHLPSHELIGTYLAAVDVVTKGDYLNKVGGLIDAVRRTMITVLQACVELMKTRVESLSAQV
jgi:hypothetical protein